MKTWNFKHRIIFLKTKSITSIKKYWISFYNEKLVKFKWVAWAHDKSFFKVIKVMGKTFSQIWLQTRSQSRKKNTRILLYSWLPTGTYIIKFWRFWNFLWVENLANSGLFFFPCNFFLKTYWNPLCRSKPYFSLRNLAKFRPEKTNTDSFVVRAPINH
jgi:hypothetical protein